MKVLQRKTSYKISYLFATAAFVFSTVVSPLLSATTVAAATLPLVSTGAESACAVVNATVKCWGNNDKGQLGIGTLGGTKTNPTAVYAKTTATPAQTTTSCFWIWCTTQTIAPEIPASAMGDKKVTKISVGAKHVCALANASVYCWGDNSSGQLGRSGGDASLPVAVSVSSPSALQGKEVIDIAASNNYTCALASDGSVACWGNNQYGQLGNGSYNASSIPTAVVKTGELAGQRGVQLAKVAGYSMCVLARAASDSSSSSVGAPYCWGMGMGRGTVPASSTTTLTTCSPVTNSSLASTYFNANTPVRIAGNTTFGLADGNTYITGLGTDNGTYYWGMHGYRGTVTYRATGTVGSTGEADKSLANTGGVNNETAFAQNPIMRLASVSTDKAKANNKPGADKNKNLNSNNNAVKQASQTANQYNPNGASSSSSGYSSTQRGGSYAGVASPGSNPPPSANVGNNKTTTQSSPQPSNGGRSTPTPTPTPTPTTKVTPTPTPVSTPTPTPTTKVTPTPTPVSTPTPTPPPTGCKATTYSVESVFTELGTLNATRHTASSLTNGGLSTLSGNVVDDLFCAVKTGGAVYCDANGTSVTEGQTGSNYTQSCTQSNGFTVCALPPSGPQAVYTGGWLGGKTIVSLSTEPSGYTCAVANDSTVGCWGMNNLGQLGVGDTTNKKVPTRVNL